MPTLTVELILSSTEARPLCTEVWASKKVQRVLEKFARDDNVGAARWIKKVQRCAISGFEKFISDDGVIRPKWDQVYALQTGDSLLRVAGFFPEGQGYREFIACEAYWKNGQKMDSSDRERVNAVASVRRSGLWERG